MNFEGRYYTDNETLVAVHKANVPTRGETYFGHDIEGLEKKPKDQPFEYDPVKRYYWDEMGKCLLVFGTVDAVSKFNLSRSVNPMTYAFGMKVEWCKECGEWGKHKGSGGR